MKVQTKKFSTIIILSLLISVMTSAIYAKDDAYVKEGTYLGIFRTQNQMSGDFKGITYLSTPSKFYDVPNLESGDGFGVVLGGRASDGSFEFGYQRSRHDTSSLLFGYSEASYNLIDMNFKFDCFAQERIKPYILFGFGYSWLTIEDGSYNGSYDDATYHGFAWNMGAGAAYYFHPQWAVTGGVTKRWNGFGTVDGVEIADSLSENTFCFNIGIIFTF